MCLKSSIVFILTIMTGLPLQAQLNLVVNSESTYAIIVSQYPSKSDVKAAEVLQHYLKEISGAKLPILGDNSKPTAFEICIGITNRSSDSEKFVYDGFILKTNAHKLFIYGKHDKSALYGVYHFLENYLGCRKYAAALGYIPEMLSISIPFLNDLQNPDLSFRQVYYPDQYDEEFRNWHKLHLLEDVWGIWGHSFNKLVPASVHFKSHPEYFSLVNGKRADTQLCLSNPDVFNILTINLGKQMLEQPEKQLWSVSQNDGFGYCTCSSCKAIDKKYGGPQGSIIYFANKVAVKFPDKTISTLAYLYSAHPPTNLKPAKNVSVMLSTINLDRGRPISTNPRAATFRNELKGWSEITQKLMIWDYVVQFTNYQSPFPNLNYLQDNMQYFAANSIEGIFVQGTESSSGEFSALKTYVLAKSTWAPQTDLSTHFEEFIAAWYGKAGGLIKEYNQKLTETQAKSNRLLDIYGDPVIERKSWLSPEQIESYSTVLDRASEVAELEPAFLQHVKAERLALEYAVIQQARFYGLEKHGLFIRSGSSWAIRPGYESKVQRFINTARESGVTMLGEIGPTLDAYATEWENVFRKGPLIHDAIRSKVTPIIPYSDEYPGKGAVTLTDGSRGYDNFQYNYLGWHGTDLEVVIDLGRVQSIRSLTAGFLEDQRHWAFLPLSIQIEVSSDNTIFHQVVTSKLPFPKETDQPETHRFQISFDQKIVGRYIRFKAQNLKELPLWRRFPGRKSWLFCDEISVFN